jgi:AsmA protein
MSKASRSILERSAGYLPAGGKRVLRVLLAIVVVAILLFGLFRVTAPFLIQAAVMRSGIERAIAEWTGHDVTIEGSPSITFWPQARIEVSRITVSKAGPEGVRVISRTASLSAAFSLYQAVLGRAVFRDFQLVEPEIFVVRDQDGRLDLTNDGLLSAATRSMAASGAQEPLAPALDSRVGNVTVVNGRIEIKDTASGDTLRAAAINGIIRWPRLSSAMDAQVTARINGRSLQLSLSSPQPLALLAGRSAPLEGGLASDVLSGRFDGTANIAEYGFVSGDLGLSVPDMASLLDWAGVELAALSPLKQLSLSAQVLTTGETVRFDQMELSLNGSAGRGLVDLLLSDGMPRLTGTLAFERLDLAGLLGVVSSSPQDGGSGASSTLPLDLDLRISGEEAAAGPLMLSDMAISIMTTSKEARLDILDGSLGGGRITGQLIGDNGSFASGSQARLFIRDADLGELSARLGLARPFPLARGSIETSFSSPGPLGAFALDRVDGNLKVTTGPGTIPDAEPTVILQRVSDQRYSPLFNPNGEDFGYERLELEASLSGGVAQLEHATIESPATRVTMMGIIDYRDGGLALSMDIGAPSEGPATESIFVGGTWTDPVAVEVPRRHLRQPG